jgi:siroheme synthase
MGLSTAPGIAARLIAAGRSISTPVLVVENASLASERRVVSTLGRLGDETNSLEGPALLIIGEVAALAEVEPVVAELAVIESWNDQRVSS